jgi:hypothetical protein
MKRETEQPEHQKDDRECIEHGDLGLGPDGPLVFVATGIEVLTVSIVPADTIARTRIRVRRRRRPALSEAAGATTALPGSDDRFLIPTEINPDSFPKIPLIPASAGMTGLLAGEGQYFHRLV